MFGLSIQIIVFLYLGKKQKKKRNAIYCEDK